MITTETPIGTFEVDPSSGKVCHVIDHTKRDTLTTNQIVYRGTLCLNESVVYRGHTFATSINPDLIDKITDVDCLFMDKNKYTIYPAAGGFPYLK